MASKLPGFFQDDWGDRGRCQISPFQGSDSDLWAPRPLREEPVPTALLCISPAPPPLVSPTKENDVQVRVSVLLDGSLGKNARLRWHWTSAVSVYQVGCQPVAQTALCWVKVAGRASRGSAQTLPWRRPLPTHRLNARVIQRQCSSRCSGKTIFLWVIWDPGGERVLLFFSLFHHIQFSGKWERLAMWVCL